MNCKRWCGPHLHCALSRAGKPTWKLAPWNVNRPFQHSVQSKFFVRIKSEVLILVTERKVAGYLTVSCATLRSSMCAEGTAVDSLAGFSAYLIVEIFTKSFPPIVLPFRWNINSGHCRRPIRICAHILDWLLEHEMFATKAKRFIHSLNLYPWVWQLFR